MQRKIKIQQFSKKKKKSHKNLHDLAKNIFRTGRSIQKLFYRIVILAIKSAVKGAFSKKSRHIITQKDETESYLR